jgi:hypothetical protein
MHISTEYFEDNLEQILNMIDKKKAAYPAMDLKQLDLNFDFLKIIINYAQK